MTAVLQVKPVGSNAPLDMVRCVYVCNTLYCDFIGVFEWLLVASLNASPFCICVHARICLHRASLGFLKISHLTSGWSHTLWCNGRQRD